MANTKATSGRQNILQQVIFTSPTL